MGVLERGGEGKVTCLRLFLGLKTLISACLHAKLTEVSCGPKRLDFNNNFLKDIDYIREEWQRDTYRAEQHLHVDSGCHIDVIQLTGAVAMNDINQSIHCGFNVS